MKKAFTLLELLIVVMIITMILWSLVFLFPKNTNKQAEFGKECSTYIYHEIQTEINNLNRNKVQIISGTKHYPISKTIKFGTWTNEITIQSIFDNTWSFSNTLTSTTWTCQNKDINNIDQYFIQITTWWSVFMDNHWTTQISNQSNQNYFELNACTVADSNNCISTSKLIFHQTSQKVEQVFYPEVHSESSSALSPASPEV